MKQEPRPLFNIERPALDEYTKKYWSNSQALQYVLAELKYRKSQGAIALQKK